jgi:hypothetical protein
MANLLGSILAFVLFAIAFLILINYLSSGKYGIGTTWIRDTLDIAESELSLYSMVILSIIFAVVLVFIATRKFTPASGAVTVLIAGLFYLLASSARGSGINISVPSVGYPISPHFGLGAVSLENRFPNRVGYGVN